MDGGYIIAGKTASFGTGGDNFYVIKTDSLGNSLWTKTYGGDFLDTGRSIQQTVPDGGYIIVGNAGLFGPTEYDVYLVKTDSMGNIFPIGHNRWEKTYGDTLSDYGNSVQQTSDRGYIIAGSTESFGAGLLDVYLIKTDSLGDTLWTRTYGGTDRDRGYSVQQTVPDGGYIISGSTESFGAGMEDVYLIKTNPLGDTLWTKVYGGSSYDRGASIRQTSDGGFIIVGRTSSFGAGFGDVYLIKTDSSGDTLWTKTIGSSNEDVGESVQQTVPDGGYIITGSTGPFMSPMNVYLIKTDSLGSTLWTTIYGGDTLSDFGYSVQQTSDGGFIIVGKTRSFGAGLDDVYLIKTGGDGMVGIQETNNEYRTRNFEFRLIQNHPNPFNSTTTIRYIVPSANPESRIPHHISLSIYDITGRLVETLVNENKEPGVYQVHWEGKDQASGIYFYRLDIRLGQALDYTDTRKLVILR
jgi:hypothetical protein